MKKENIRYPTTEIASCIACLLLGGCRHQRTTNGTMAARHRTTIVAEPLVVAWLQRQLSGSLSSDRMSLEHQNRRIIAAISDARVRSPEGSIGVRPTNA